MTDVPGYKSRSPLTTVNPVFVIVDAANTATFVVFPRDGGQQGSPTHNVIFEAGVGLGVGDGVGKGVGDGVGLGVGDGVGLGVGDGVGLGVGEGVGEGVGFGVGCGVGDGVGGLVVLWQLQLYKHCVDINALVVL